MKYLPANKYPIAALPRWAISDSVYAAEAGRAIRARQGTVDHRNGGLF